MYIVFLKFAEICLKTYVFSLYNFSRSYHSSILVSIVPFGNVDWFCSLCKVKSQTMTNFRSVHTICRINNSVIGAQSDEAAREWTRCFWSEIYVARASFSNGAESEDEITREKHTQVAKRERGRWFVSCAAAAAQLTFYLLPAAASASALDMWSRSRSFIFSVLLLGSLARCRLVFCLARARVSNIKHWRRAVQCVWVGK